MPAGNVVTLYAETPAEEHHSLARRKAWTDGFWDGFWIGWICGICSTLVGVIVFLWRR